MNFRALHPLVRVRILQLNSRQVAEAVRGGDLEAGLVALPIDDRSLDIGPVEWTAEAVYFSRRPVHRPVSIHELADAELILPDAQWGDMDPTRHQLLALTQNAGVSVRPIVEVESPALAFGPGRARRWRHSDLLAVGTRTGIDAQSALELP